MSRTPPLTHATSSCFALSVSCRATRVSGLVAALRGSESRSGGPTKSTTSRTGGPTNGRLSLTLRDSGRSGIGNRYRVLARARPRFEKLESDRFQPLPVDDQGCSEGNQLVEFGPDVADPLAPFGANQAALVFGECRVERRLALDQR